jgi:uncharacterized protein (DUF362 family)
MTNPQVAIVHRGDLSGSPNEYRREDMVQVKGMLKEALDQIGGIPSFVEKGDRVIIKPNITYHLPMYEVAWSWVTDPRVIEGLIELIKEESGPGDIVVAECSAFGWDTSTAFRGSGIEDAAVRAGAQVLPLEKDEFREVEIPDGKVLKRVRLPRSVLEADVFITVPKMKTNIFTEVTLSLKNQQGILLWGDKQKAHRTDIDQKFPDLYKAVKPDLAIVDGIWAVQGQGPAPFRDEYVIRDMNTIVAGRDSVAVDAVASALMGFDPFEVRTTRIAHQEGLGEADLRNIEIKGKSIKEVRRIFRRGDPDPRGVYPNVNVYANGACKGCLGSIRFLLDLMDGLGILEERGRLNFIAGVDASLPEKLEGETYIVGDCAKEHRDKGAYWPGCAPIATMVQEGERIMGIDMPKQQQI